MTDLQSIDYTVVDRDEQPFVGVTRTLTMATLNQAADEVPGLLKWLDQHGQGPAGPPFIRYLVIDMANDMVVQTGVPVGERLEAADGIEADVLPAGRYATTTHVGPYEGLYDATRGLLRWAGEQGLHFDKQPSGQGEVWGSRIEWYETNPLEHPDPKEWVTRLTFRLAD
jgi:effector-binding domain-containing protein